MTQNWHEKSIHEIAANFKINLSSGLTESEAQKRLNEFGLNKLIKQKKQRL